MIDLDQVSILSVKHTGTNFLDQLIKEYLGPVRAAHWSHSRPDKLPKIVVSPIRNPQDVYTTWYSRGRFGPEFFKEWQVFNEAFLLGIPTIVPVDTPDREFHLNKLSNRLGVDLQTEWVPVESQTRYPAPEIDLSSIYELEVVKAFYALPQT